MSTNLPYAANCSLLFTEVALLERPAAAKAAGFDAIEFWWPWPDQPVPADSTVDEFVTAVRDSGVSLIGLNFFAGDLVGPDCGVLSIPARSAQFTRQHRRRGRHRRSPRRAGLQRALRQPGRRRDTRGSRTSSGIEQLGLAAAAAAKIGATVLVEPVSGPKPYPLRTADDVIKVLDRVERRQRRLPLRPVPPGQQRRRHRRGPRGLRRPDRPRADRRLSRPRRTRQRHPRPRSTTSVSIEAERLLRSCRSRVQPDPPRPWTASPGCRDRDRLTEHRKEIIMSTIAFIGLGIMGGPMAGHLVKAGHTVIGVNRSHAARGEAGGGRRTAAPTASPRRYATPR